MVDFWKPMSWFCIMASENHNKFPTCYISPPLFQQWPYLKGGPVGVTGFSCPGISTKVLVIGGGLSGLSCAWHVAEHGTMVKLLEVGVCKCRSTELFFKLKP